MKRPFVVTSFAHFVPTFIINLTFILHFLVLCAGFKYFDPVQITTALREIQGLYASENEAEKRLLENCRRAGLKVHGHTPADGNCFFHAVADQLSLLGLPHQSATRLRNGIVCYLKDHPQVQVSKMFFSDHFRNLLLS